jgi:hypothetical protein
MPRLAARSYLVQTGNWRSGTSTPGDEDADPTPRTRSRAGPGPTERLHAHHRAFIRLLHSLHRFSQAKYSTRRRTEKLAVRRAAWRSADALAEPVAPQRQVREVGIQLAQIPFQRPSRRLRLADGDGMKRRVSRAAAGDSRDVDR